LQRVIGSEERGFSGSHNGSRNRRKGLFTRKVTLLNEGGEIPTNRGENREGHGRPGKRAKRRGENVGPMAREEMKGNKRQGGSGKHAGEGTKSFQEGAMAMRSIFRGPECPREGLKWECRRVVRNNEGRGRHED